MTQHVFFQNIGNVTENRQMSKEEQTYIFNSMLFELIANWDYVIELLYKYKNGLLKSAANLEVEWINFLINNNINVSDYPDNPEKFLEKYMKTI